MLNVELILDGIVYGTHDGTVVVEQGVEQGDGDTTVYELLIQGLGSLVEDVAEDAVVDEIVFCGIGLLEIADIAIEEAQLTTQVGAYGRGTDTAMFFGEAVVEDIDDGGCFLDGLGLS